MVSECFNDIFIEWYFKLPLSPKISLNGPMVLNDTEWYSNVISGILCHCLFFCKGPSNE